MREAIKSAATRRVGACLNRNQISCQYLTIKPGHAQSAGPVIQLARGLQNRSKIASKINQNVDVILDAFLVPLGSLLASLLGPLGRPNRPKFRLKCLLNAYLHEKREFCSRIGFSNTKMLFRTPRWPPKCPKIAPRRLQEGLEKHLFSTSFLPSILVHFWSRFGSLLAPFWAPKTTPKSLQKSIKNRLATRWPPRPLQDRPRASQDAPRTPPDPLKTPQDPPKTPPKSLPGPSWTVQKIENFEIVENMSKKSRPWSPTMVTQYHRSKESKVSSQQSNPRGWRRWSREALFNPPPLAQHGVLRLPLEDLLYTSDF